MARPKRLLVRQGDILLIPRAELPYDAQPIPRSGRCLVIARGEATGHTHAIVEADVLLFVSKDDRYILVPSTVLILHEEHTSVPLLPGVYEVRRQRSLPLFLHTLTRSRNVLD